MDITTIFFIIGVIIVIGFLGGLFFQKTSIPDVLVLLTIGVIIGPVLNIIGAADISHFAEYFGSFALMIILFEGGMETEIKRLVKGLGTATVLVVSSFVLSACSIGAYLHLGLRWEIPQSLLLGIILACTSAAIVMPLVQKLPISHGVKTILSVESALGDVLAVVLVVTVLDYMVFHNIGIQAPFRTLASSFSIAILCGAAAGCFWLKALDSLKKKQYFYMATLAILFLLHAAVDFLGGSGPIAVLVFGIVLGNNNEFGRFLKLKKDGWVGETIKFFHGEVSFFIRTFFFVYMGMIISFKSVSAEFLLIVAALTGIIAAARFISVRITGFLSPETRKNSSFIFFMLPRGLASAVLATSPMALNIRGCDQFVNYTFGVIVLSNLLMTAGAIYHGRKRTFETPVEEVENGSSPAI
ncbi:MAG TPA: hypothetical protein DCR97_09235 [Deltaproteobacteria bacterium]|nr:hypothetical protein [Deltaproteobacteria bacterium]